MAECACLSHLDWPGFEDESAEPFPRSTEENVFNPGCCGLSGREASEDHGSDKALNNGSKKERLLMHKMRSKHLKDHETKASLQLEPSFIRIGITSIPPFKGMSCLHNNLVLSKYSSGFISRPIEGPCPLICKATSVSCTSSKTPEEVSKSLDRGTCWSALSSVIKDEDTHTCSSYTTYTLIKSNSNLSFLCNRRDEVVRSDSTLGVGLWPSQPAVYRSCSHISLQDSKQPAQPCKRLLRRSKSSSNLMNPHSSASTTLTSILKSPDCRRSKRPKRVSFKTETCVFNIEKEPKMINKRICISLFITTIAIIIASALILL